MVASDYTVVIPAYNAAATIGACLDALRAAEPAPAEIILYDDGSTDGTNALAEARGVRIIEGATRQAGPAVGRNVGVRAARTERVVVVDADVVVEPDAPGRLAEALGGDVVASFGAYAGEASVSRLAGRYANLRHHHTHVTAGEKTGGEAETFWSGLGAVRRDAFLRVGGFDEAFERPCVEDVELGLRLREEGRIRIVSEAQGHHLKDWTLRQLWHTDIHCRALPWSAMIAEGRIPATLNTDRTEQAKSVLAHLVWLFLAAAVLAVALAPPLAPPLASSALLAAAGALVAYLWMNRRFLRVLARDSAALVVVGGALHLSYHLYASVTCALVLASHGLRTRMGRRTDDADAAVSARA